MKKLAVLLLVLALAAIAFLFYFVRFEPTSRYSLDTTPSEAPSGPGVAPSTEKRIDFSLVANGVSNYLLGVEFSLMDKVPEEINESDLEFYETALRMSQDLGTKPEIAPPLHSIFSEVRVLRSKLMNSVSKLEKLAQMKKGLTDTEKSYRERVELRRYNIQKEIGRDADAILARIKFLRSEIHRLGTTHGMLSLPVSDPFVTALGSTRKGPATRGYPPPLDGAPTQGELKICEAQVLSVSVDGTLAVEMEYTTGPVDYLRSIGGGAGHVPRIAVPGTKVLYFQGLRHGVIEDQRIHVLARRAGVYRYTARNGNQRSAERWNFIRFAHLNEAP